MMNRISEYTQSHYERVPSFTHSRTDSPPRDHAYSTDEQPPWDWHGEDHKDLDDNHEGTAAWSPAGAVVRKFRVPEGDGWGVSPVGRHPHSAPAPTFVGPTICSDLGQKPYCRASTSLASSVCPLQQHQLNASKRRCCVCCWQWRSRPRESALFRRPHVPATPTYRPTSSSTSSSKLVVVPVLRTFSSAPAQQ